MHLGAAFAAALAWTIAQAARADDAAPVHATFDTSLLRSARHGPVDVSRFERGATLAPGLHDLDVHRNGRPVGRRRVRFEAEESGGSASACIDRPLAEALGLSLSRLTHPQRRSLSDPGTCIRLPALVPGARAVHDAAELALHVTIPQAALVQRADDLVDPALRDRGITAFRMNYALTALHRDDRARDDDGTQASARVELGFNAAAWRLRHRGTHAWRAGGPLRSDTIATTLERDLDAFDAQVTIGEFHTRGVLFDSIGLRGVRVASDDRMVPPSRARYAPVIRGIAATPARVQVRQAGLLLLDTTVPAGPFALRDVQPLGLGGALEVRMVEADGHATTFAVPHAALPGLLRPGHARFDVAAGTWRGASGASSAQVFQGTWQAGVHDRLTAQFGAQLAPDYAHALGGIAFSTRAGAFSLDRSISRSAIGAGVDARIESGSSLRLAYAGHVAPTRTSIDVAAWRHGSDGFRTLHDAMRRRDPATASHARERTRFDLSLRQDFGRRGGALSLGVVDRTYRARRDGRRSLQASYGLPFGAAGAMLQGTIDRVLHASHRTTQGMVSLSLPLRIGPATHALHAQARVADDHGGMQAGVDGAFGRDARYAYGLGVLHSRARRHGHATTTSGTLGMQGSAGRVGAGLSVSPRTRQWSMTAEGGLLLHAGGATLGPAMGETVALLRAKHGDGTQLLHHPRIRLDRDGHAIVPHLSPYRRNRIGIDPRDAGPDVHFDWTERDIVPRAGAIVEVALPATRAPTRWLRLVQPDGAPVPFASEITDARGIVVGNVGRNGVALVRAPSDSLHVDIRWRDAGENVRCSVALFDPQPTIRDALCVDVLASAR
jgi:outer membrane usher protein